jgi:hypothetical protein
LGTEELPSITKEKMAGKTLHEPTRSGQILLTRNRFEYNIVRGDVPPYYFDNSAWENETGMSYRNFDLPYSAGRCKVSWPNGVFQFEWR